jgi:hypothetical protein
MDLSGSTNWALIWTILIEQPNNTTPTIWDGSAHGDFVDGVFICIHGPMAFRFPHEFRSGEIYPPGTPLPRPTPQPWNCLPVAEVR